MPVNESEINHVADLLTDDPSLVLEQRGAYAGDFSADEVPLDPDETMLAQVQYEYYFNQHGKHLPASHLEPAEHPETEVTGARVTDMAVRDLDGNPIKPRTPQEVQMWERSAVQYFMRHLRDYAAEQAAEMMAHNY